MLWSASHSSSCDSLFLFALPTALRTFALWAPVWYHAGRVRVDRTLVRRTEAGGAHAGEKENKVRPQSHRECVTPAPSQRKSVCV